MNIVLDDKVPMPPPAENKAVYPWKEMKVGQSFVVGAEKRGSISAGAKRAKIKVTARVVLADDPAFEFGVEKIRVWRTE